MATSQPQLLKMPLSQHVSLIMILQKEKQSLSGPKKVEEQSLSASEKSEEHAPLGSQETEAKPRIENSGGGLLGLAYDSSDDE